MFMISAIFSVVIAMRDQNGLDDDTGFRLVAVSGL
jgi:hypothetical protein